MPACIALRKGAGRQPSENTINYGCVTEAHQLSSGLTNTILKKKINSDDSVPVLELLTAALLAAQITAKLVRVERREVESIPTRHDSGLM